MGTKRSSGELGRRAMVMGAMWVALSLPALARAKGSVELPLAEPMPAVHRAERWSLHGQMTFVEQARPALRSPYAGPNSLQAAAEVALSYTATIFAALRPWQGATLIFNPEVSGGEGLSSTHGLGGFANGEIYRVGSRSPRFNLSRLLLQQIWSLGAEPVWLPAAANQLGAASSARRLTLVAGKFSLSDYLDSNAYAHDPRSQFLNWALMDAGAYDYAADTRGYTWGVYGDYSDRTWSLRMAAALEPAVANGLTLDLNLARAHSLNVELEWRYSLLGRPGEAHLLLFSNHARMGLYDAALRSAAGGRPDITRSRAYRAKRGLAINLEQSLGGAHGLFMRLSLSDGRTESWAFTEIDQALALGVQGGGELWGRADDRAGLALMLHGLAAPHRAYLAHGGLGFMLGDGGLNYAPEAIIEVYYLIHPLAWLTLTADLQLVRAPGYNADRGPVAIAALRLHLEL